MRTPSCSQLAVDLPPVGRPIVGFLKAGETRRAVGRLALGLYGVGEQRRDERILYQIAEQLVEVILQLRASRIASSRIQRHLLADIIRYVHTCSALLPMLIQQLSGSHAHNIATMHYTVEIQATYYIPSGTHTHCWYSLYSIPLSIKSPHLVQLHCTLHHFPFTDQFLGTNEPASWPQWRCYQCVSGCR